MKQRFMQWMIGRNGPDHFSRFLTYAALVLVVLRLFLRGTAGTIAWVLALAALIYAYFRMFSRNVAKRREENAKYFAYRTRVVNAFRDARERWRQRKDYCFFRCPSCRAMLRVPKGKGRVRVTCRKCGNAFERKT